MLQLPNNCRASAFSVNPSNWRGKADMKSNWYISYRFYDDNLNEKKKVIIKAMNKFKSLKERQDATEKLMKEEMDILLSGKNFITKYDPNEVNEAINPDTPFIDALYYAAETKQMVKHTREDIRSALGYFK